MTTTMIERVAKVLADNAGDGRDDTDVARAAIEAMREPDEETKAAIRKIAGDGAVAWWIAGHYTMIDVALKEKQP